MLLKNTNIVKYAYGIDIRIGKSFIWWLTIIIIRIIMCVWLLVLNKLYTCLHILSIPCTNYVHKSNQNEIILFPAPTPGRSSWPELSHWLCKLIDHGCLENFQQNYHQDNHDKHRLKWPIPLRPKQALS